MFDNYDIIVVGGGHAGCEAAAIGAKLNKKVLLISHDITRFAAMSCNPAMGGIAKGQILREIDALGGQSAIVTDRTTIQFRMLNRSKGPAIWSPRAQCDKYRFSEEWRKILDSFELLDLWQDDVIDLIIENDTVIGVKTKLNANIYAKKVILTNGTFLNGEILIGQVKFEGGRIAESSSKGLTENLVKLGFTTARLKTGTPVRIDGKTINFDALVEQPGDEDWHKFSYSNNEISQLKSMSCFIATTNIAVHKNLETGFEFSPLFDGTIQGTGPRYCPSIETKLITFPDKQSHQLFVEPEGNSVNEYYLNGFSSSLPWEVQLSSLRLIPGFEKAKIFKPGYAIEYDFFEPTQLYHTLETKLIKNLYFAGQINGTTGYEEAAGQGLMAGINAAINIDKKDPFILGRDQAYIGVLIDDLITKGVDEPYRMFTSRAEHRVLLRQDNADRRLMPFAINYHLLSETRIENYKLKLSFIEKGLELLKNSALNPNEINPFLVSIQEAEIKQKAKLSQLLTRPNIYLKNLIDYSLDLKNFFLEVPLQLLNEVHEALEIEVKYKGYIERETQIAEKIKKMDQLNIPDKFDFEKINSISTEARQKLQKIRPQTIGQASRIPGVSPSDINVLLVFLGR